MARQTLKPPGFPDLHVTATSQGIRTILFRREEADPDQSEQAHAVLALGIAELREYFRGNRELFSVPVDLEGTVFQQEVWRHLRDIPFGETTSYGAIATALGRPNAVRAVGAANGKNPVSIIVPCHRVIGSDGKLTGYAGGVDVKARLLALEGATLDLFSLAGARGAAKYTNSRKKP